jgi:archaellum biogenesis protein FlaJ (TadC family)
MNKIATLYGRPLEEFTKEELIEAMDKLAEYYEMRIENMQQSIDFERDIRKRRKC